MRRLPSLVLLTACAGGSPLADGPLVDHGAWTLAEPGLDPFPTHRPEGAACSERGFYEERGALEVDTTLCGYFVGTTPALLPVRAGDTVTFHLAHAALAAPDESAEAHVALALDGRVLWETVIPIPSPPDAHEAVVEAPADAPAGAPVVLHLHNHGVNTWTLLDVEVRR